MAVRHLQHDDEGRDRRLNDSGEIADHAEQDHSTHRHMGQQPRHVGPKAGTDSERGREDAAGNAAHRGKRRRQQLERAETHRHLAGRLDQRLRLGIAGAISEAARGEADDRDQQAAERREGHGMALGQPPCASRQSTGEEDHDHAEETAEEAARHAADRHFAPDRLDADAPGKSRWRKWRRDAAHWHAASDRTDAHLATEWWWQWRDSSNWHAPADGPDADTTTERWR